MPCDNPHVHAQKKVWADVSPREVIRRRYFPDLTLTSHEGRRVHLYQDLVKDKIVIMNFMYATCKGICSPVTANLQRVQGLLGRRVGDDIFFYSFTLKPREDTPEVLRGYVDRHGIGPGWLFLTGPAGDMELLRRRLGYVDPDPRLDAVPTNHTGMIRYGNEPLLLWAACPGMARPESIRHSISFVDWPRRG